MKRAVGRICDDKQPRAVPREQIGSAQVWDATCAALLAMTHDMSDLPSGDGVIDGDPGWSVHCDQPTVVGCRPNDPCGREPGLDRTARKTHDQDGAVVIAQAISSRLEDHHPI